MTINPNDDDIEKPTKKTDPLQSKTVPPEEEIPQESGGSDVDALQELRQNLYSEENPKDSSKTDIFKRMTESLANRKTPQPPKDANNSLPVFGVRTAGNAPFDSTGRQDPESDLNRNTVILQGGPKSEPYIKGRFKTQPSDSQDEQEKLLNAEDQQNLPFTTESKVRPIDPDEQDADWQDDAVDHTIGHERPASLLDEKIDQAQNEKKRLGSGFDRQQQVSRYISYNPRRSFVEKFKELSAVERSLIFALVIAVLGLVSLIAYLFIESRQTGPGSTNPVVAEFTPTPTVSIPVPARLQMMGGWSFELKSGIMVDGVWNPTTSEWLLGTEVRRVIAIPWNKQIEAVVQTFEPGDLLELDMSNGDTYSYKVLTVSEIAVDDTSILYDNRPTLAVILIKPEAEKRWVVVAEPQ